MNRCKICGQVVHFLQGKYISIGLWDCTEEFGARVGEIFCHVNCFQEAAGDEYIQELTKKAYIGKSLKKDTP